MSDFINQLLSVSTDTELLAAEVLQLRQTLIDLDRHRQSLVEGLSQLRQLNRQRRQREEYLKSKMNTKDRESFMTLAEKKLQFFTDSFFIELPHSTVSKLIENDSTQLNKHIDELRKEMQKKMLELHRRGVTSEELDQRFVEFAFSAESENENT